MNRTNSSYVPGATHPNRLRVGLKWVKNGIASHAGLNELQAYILNKTALTEEKMKRIEQSTIEAMQNAVEILMIFAHTDADNMDDGVVGLKDTINFLIQEIERYDPLIEKLMKWVKVQPQGRL